MVVLTPMDATLFVDEVLSGSSVNAWVIAGSISGGLIGLLVVVVTVVTLRKYEIISQCFRKPEEHKALGDSNNMRSIQPDINNTGYDYELETNIYESLDGDER
ncbi:uncharacterized protein LOC127852497 [Dreissena polymorpha]|uniref:uncharacterized protein LOC127852497 n=1 Tax=Dreissena polymorpha TaxID=45954 RepID=UPI0022642107|nr:uncharacterized protein LOC127852497 [Dreissena polymorpha]